MKFTVHLQGWFKFMCILAVKKIYLNALLGDFFTGESLTIAEDGPTWLA